MPPEGWKPEGFDPATLKGKPLVTTANVSAANAIRTPSFDPGLLPPRMLYLGGGMICPTLLALIGATSTAVFVLLAVVILSFYGGGFATVPAYLRDCSAASRWGRDPRTAAHRLVGGGRGRPC